MKLICTLSIPSSEQLFSNFKVSIASEPESEPEPKTPTKKRTHARRATPPPVTPTPIKTPK